jgi:hypothetical protein
MVALRMSDVVVPTGLNEDRGDLAQLQTASGETVCLPPAKQEPVARV